jgi:hypothetical protein
MPNMTAPTGTVVIKSTSDLSPAGILGYAKGIAVTLGAVLVAVAEVIPEDWPYKRYVQGAILLLTIIGTIGAPNAVKPVTVPPPAMNVDPDADRAAPGTVLGVVNPPERPNDGI